MTGLPKKYAKMGFKKGWEEYKKTAAYKKSKKKSKSARKSKKKSKKKSKSTSKTKTPT